MKKIIIILVLVLIMVPIKTKAITPVVEYQEGIYSNRVERGSGGQTYNGKLGYIYLDNQIAYCLDPFKIIGKDYIVDTGNTALSNLVLDYTKLITYYGYGTHLGNIYYYMATQEIIWLESPLVSKVYWTVDSTTTGTRIAIDIYKKEIMDKAAKARVKPDFQVDTISGDYGDVIELNDYNQVLNEYEIVNNSNNEIWKENNKLYIRILDLNTIDVKFVKTMKSGNYTRGYLPTTSNQILGTFSINETVESSLSITPNEYNSKIKITRYANQKKVNGKIKFKLFNVNHKEFLSANNNEIFETDNQGNFISDFKLGKGTYEIINVEIPDNFILNNYHTSFTITEENILNNYVYEIDDYLDIPHGILNINARMNYLTQKIPLSNEKYYLYAGENIYDENYHLIYYKGALIDELSTNSDGSVKYDLLLGTYYILDLEGTKYNFDLHYIDVYTKEITYHLDIEKVLPNSNIIINTHLKTCNKELCEMTAINDLTYSIYTDEDITVNGNLIYKKDELVYEINSNELTKINLISGKYYIVESENNYEDKFKNYYFNYDGNDINLDIIKIKTLSDDIVDIPIINDTIEDSNSDTSNDKMEESNNVVTVEKNNNILPNTSNYLSGYYYLSIILVIAGISLKIIYEIHKNN